MMTEAWRFGLHPAEGNPRWPEPSRFILGSVAMGFAAVVAQFNPRIGGLLAWGLLIGAIVQQAGPKKQSVTASASQSVPPQHLINAPSTTRQTTFQV